MDIRLIDGEFNYADALTKALPKTFLDGNITQLMDNGPGQGANNLIKNNEPENGYQEIVAIKG